MNEVHSITRKILPIIKVVIDCYNNNMHLFPLQNTIHDLQIATNWLVVTAKEIPDASDELVTNTGSEVKVNQPLVTTPTLIGTRDTLLYAKTQLEDIHNQLELFTESQSSIVHNNTARKLYNGADRIMESIFNVNIALTYYEQPQPRVA